MFGVAGAPSAGLINTPSSPAIKTGNDTVSTVTDCGLSTCGSAHGPVTGDVTATNRTIDVDGDGRADVVSNVNGAARVFFNGGGAFLTAGPSYPGDLNGARRNVHARAEFPGDANSKLLWELRSDLIDLDGDGIAESVDIPSGLPMTRMTRSYSVPPPRLLNKIKNGRGAETSISYASLHNPTFVTQTPGELWFDGRPKATPHNQWVVAVMSTTDSFPSTATSTASYFYKNPRHGADDEGHYSFRGFETVTTTGQSGAQTVQVYSYTPDWSGRLVKTLVIPARTEWADSGLGVAEVRSMEATTWEYRQLFNGAITTFHATVSEHFVCPNGRNEGVCTMSPAGYTRSTTTLAPLASTTVLGQPAQMWQATESLLQTGTAAADGDRQTISTFAFASDTTTYRLRPLTATKNHAAAARW